MNAYTFGDMQAGMTAGFEVEIDDEMMLRFMELSGDVNPLHRDADFARAHGHPGCVVYGMLTSSFYSQLVGVHLPGMNCLLQGIEVKMRAPVYVGDVLSVSGIVEELHESVRMARIKAEIRNQAGKRVSSAKIQVGFLE